MAAATETGLLLQWLAGRSDLGVLRRISMILRSRGLPLTPLTPPLPPPLPDTNHSRPTSHSSASPELACTIALTCRSRERPVLIVVKSSSHLVFLRSNLLLTRIVDIIGTQALPSPRITPHPSELQNQLPIPIRPHSLTFSSTNLPFGPLARLLFSSQSLSRRDNFSSRIAVSDKLGDNSSHLSVPHHPIPQGQQSFQTRLLSSHKTPLNYLPTLAPSSVSTTNLNRLIINHNGALRPPLHLLAHRRIRHPHPHHRHAGLVRQRLHLIEPAHAQLHPRALHRLRAGGRLGAVHVDRVCAHTALGPVRRAGGPGLRGRADRGRGGAAGDCEPELCQLLGGQLLCQFGPVWVLWQAEREPMGGEHQQAVCDVEGVVCVGDYEYHLLLHHIRKSKPHAVSCILFQC